MSMFPPRPTELLHSLLRECITPGDLAVDATAGNGHDTCFLADAVGTAGRVIAIDIQEKAISTTRTRLEGLGLLERTSLHQGSHTDIREFIGDGVPAVIVFNLGYLPGGDRSVITTTEGTLAALSCSVEILRPGGALAVVCYPGHAGGDVESAVVENFIAAMPLLRTARYSMVGTQKPSPFLLVSWKRM